MEFGGCSSWRRAAEVRTTDQWWPSNLNDTVYLLLPVTYACYISVFPFISWNIHKGVLFNDSTHHPLNGRALLGEIEESLAQYVEGGAVHFEDFFDALHSHRVAIVHGFAIGLKTAQ